MRTVFILGSGISLDAGMPSVSAITEQVLSGDGVIRHTTGSYVIDGVNPNFAWLRRPVEPVLQLIDELARAAASYLGEAPNYEQVSLLASQVHDALSGEHESAAIMPFAERLRALGIGSDGGDSLRELAGEARDYIADTVHSLLAKPPQRTDHLRVITDACAELKGATLATLNHDLVLEAALADADLEYADGFETAEGDLRLWTNGWETAAVSLLKLHGSIDWWGYFAPDEPWRGIVAARFTGNDPDHPQRIGFDLPTPPRPIFLTGTFNKILAYESWLFPDQHNRFHDALRDASRVVVIGYGFGDKAINSRLIGWLARSRDHRMIVCDPRLDALHARARGAIRNSWDRWRSWDQLVLIEATVGDIDYRQTLAPLISSR